MNMPWQRTKGCLETCSLQEGTNKKYWSSKFCPLVGKKTSEAIWKIYEWIIGKRQFRKTLRYLARKSSVLDGICQEVLLVEGIILGGSLVLWCSLKLAPRVSMGFLGSFGKKATVSLTLEVKAVGNSGCQGLTDFFSQIGCCHTGIYGYPPLTRPLGLPWKWHFWWLMMAVRLN